MKSKTYKLNRKDLLVLVRYKHAESSGMTKVKTSVIIKNINLHSLPKSPRLIVVRGRVDDDEYEYPTIPPLPRRRRGGRDNNGSSATLVRDLPEVGH